MRLPVLLLILCAASLVKAQQNTSYGWYAENSEQYQTATNLKKAHQRFFTKPYRKKPTCIAVISTGVDIQHPALQYSIWTNEDEEPNNKKDDDGNGYVDDVHGWNFLGTRDGQNLHYDQLAITRYCATYREAFEGKSDSSIPDSLQQKYQLFQEYWSEIQNSWNDADRQVKMHQQVYTALKRIDQERGEQEVTPQLIRQYQQSDDPLLKQAAMMAANLFNSEMSLGELKEQTQQALQYYKASRDYHYNVNWDRARILGEAKVDGKTSYIGNGDVVGPDPTSGTAIAGLIEEVANGSLPENSPKRRAVIMPIRAVPDGDATDQDIAAAIRYAVDNGADVIYLGAQKPVPLHQMLVEQAILHAEEAGVLVVHAAGNNAKEITPQNNFPNDVVSFPDTSRLDTLRKTQERVVTNWLEVSSTAKEGRLIPGYANYSSQHVDIFAPGHEIEVHASVEKRDTLNGSQFSAAIVAGAVALIYSKCKNCDMARAKEAILKSARSINVPVHLPKTRDTMVDLQELCLTGSVLDIYEAVRYCIENY